MNVQEERIENNNTCLVCVGKLIFDIEKNERICSRCGVVAETDGEYQSNFEESLNSNVPSLTMMYDISLSTLIDKKNVDAQGKNISRGFELDKLRNLNKYTISNDSKIRNLNKAMIDIRRITGVLGFGNLIAERSAYIYRKALFKGLIRGRSITGISVAAIYIACKESGVYFPIDKINEYIQNINKKTTVYYYKFLLRELKITIRIPEPSQNISKIASKAKLSGMTQRKALDILLQINNHQITIGKKPISLAAAALYLASLQTKEKTSQLRLAVASDLTTITIRKRYLEIVQALKDNNTKLILNNNSKEQTIEATLIN